VRLGVIAAERIGSIHDSDHEPDVPELAITINGARRAGFRAPQHDAPIAVERALATSAMAGGWAPSGDRGRMA
jgi:hypothetical protein